MQVIVAGGGIGGLTAAAVMHRMGIDVRLIEQAAELSEVGAGVQLSPNGIRILRFLGLEAALTERACQPSHYRARDWRTGGTLYTNPLNPTFTEKYGTPYFHVHRADLLEVLKSAVPQHVLSLGRRVVAIDEAGPRASVLTGNGERFEADAVIGADGIHSVVREALWGKDAPRFTGNIAWRFTVDAAKIDRSVIPFDACNWHGPHGHITMYYVSGGRKVNVVAVRETDQWAEENWFLRANADEVHAAYPNWHPIIHQLIDKADFINKWALFDRDPAPHWSRGRFTLIGDAAHPMLPFMAQGANMAIEDGYMVAALLAQNPNDIPAALKTYETMRQPRTARVQLAARERVRSMHEASGIKRLIRNLRYRFGGAKNNRLLRFNPTWVYEYDAINEAAKAR